MADRFLDKVYQAKSQDEVTALYDTWGETYDEELAETGYATPARCAAALGQFLSQSDAPILDYGCGTGMSGVALAGLGYTVIDGMDPSEGMLAVAARRRAYRDLIHISTEAPIPAEPGEYSAIASVGVISPGAGPAELIGTLSDLLGSGGYLVFSLNDHGLADPVYTGAIESALKGGSVRKAFEEYGPHIPGRDMKSTVYVLEKV